MLRLVTSVLAVTFVSSTALHAQTAEPLKVTADNLSIEVSDLRWAPLAQLSDNSIRPFGERYGLGFDYRLRQGEKTPRLFDSAIWIEDENGIRQNSGAGQKQRGELVKSYAADLNPHKRYRLVWEVPDEKAPDIADGRTEETFEFEAPLPPIGQSRKLDLKRATERGATIALREIKREENGLELTFEWQGPAGIEDFYINLNIRSGQAHDDKNTQLGGKYGSSSGLYRRTGTVVRQTVKLPGAPAADAQTLDFKLEASQMAPSQKQPQWFHRVTLPFDGAKLPVSIPATVRAPIAVAPAVAAATGEVSTATLEEVEDQNGTINARLWFEAATPRGQWRIARAQVTAEDGSEPFIQQSNGIGFDYFFNRNGAMAVGKSGARLSFSRPAGQTFALEGEAQQFESSTKTFDFADIPFPAKAGEMVAPKTVRENADGSKLILWKVGRFDTLHQPILGPYSFNTKEPLDWEGLVLVWEYRPAEPDKNVKAAFKDINFRDDNDVFFRGGVRNERERESSSGGFGSHDGDVWRATKTQDASGLTFGETQKTWFSLFKPLPSAGAKSLATTMQIEESAILGSLPFRFEAVKLPDVKTD